jgi:hypothetical protein
MTIDLLLFIGGVLGALANRLAGANPTRSWATVGEVAVSGAIMVGLVALGLVPAEWRAAMEANPLRVGLFAFAAAFLIGPGLITLGKSFFYRLTPKNGNGDKTSPGVKLGGLLLVVALLGTAACGTAKGLFDSGPPMVSAPRTDVENARVRFARVLGKIEQWAEGKCTAGDLTKDECRRAREVVAQIEAANAAYEKSVTAQGGTMNLEPLIGTLEKLLPLLLGAL